MKKFYALFLSSLLLTTGAFAQIGQKIEGRVVDAAGNPILGANVLETSSGVNGTTTGIDGDFALTLASDDAVLTFSYIGYTDQVVEVHAQTNFQIVMSEDSQALEEVVVVGYGVQKKKLVTGATSQVSGDEIGKLSSNGIMGAIQSKTTGVQISSTSAMPGAEPSMTIRGTGTIGNSSPLYVIDGVAGGSMSSLNPSDIESIDILKDAASAAIYGSRAANGVVLITTKRGKEGSYEIRYDGYYGIQNTPDNMSSLDAQGYMDIMDEKKGSPFAWNKIIPAKIYNSIKDGSWKGTNWLDEMRNKNAVTQNHALTFAGGNDRTRYSMSYSFNEQEGIYGAPVNPEYQRQNVKLNMDNVAYKKEDLDVISVGATMIYTFSKQSGISLDNRYTNDLQNAITMPSIYPLYDENGDYYDYDDYAADGWSYDPIAELPNPIGLMVDRETNENIGHRLFGNAYLEIQPIKNLKIRSSFGYKYLGNIDRTFTGLYNYSKKHSNANEKVFQSTGSQYSWTLDNTISYNFEKSGHGFDFVVGQSLDRSGFGSFLSASGSDMVFPLEWDYAWLSNTSNISSSNTKIAGYPYIQNTIASFFGRVNYDYKETYLFTAMMRADGSSKFAKGNQWGYFPSVSAGWVLSNESFMENTSSWLDFLKIRASWGRNGNCNIDNFQYLESIAYSPTAQYVFSKDKITSTPGAYADLLANPEVSWETSEQTDLGIDARFLGQRLSFTFDYYNKMTRDWLLDAPIPLIYGTGAPQINGGDVMNKGVELGLGWNDNAGEFSYSVNLNGSYNKNEVVRIANADGLINGTNDVADQNTGVLYRAQVGQPIGYFYGYETDGVFQTQDEIDNAEFAAPGSAPGDLKYVDKNGDGILSDKDKTNIGDPNPDFILGLNVSLAYKGLDFMVTANGAFGQQVFQYYRSMTINEGCNFPTIIADQRWHGEGTSNTFPRITNANNFNKITDVFVKDADYLRIQNITLGYDVNRVWKNSPLKRFRVYATLQNFFTITGYDGFDPAVGSTGGYDSWAKGVDIGYYPSPKVVLFGTNIAF